MLYGIELIKALEKEIETMESARERRAQRIANWDTDEDDCFMSERVEERAAAVARQKIDLITKDGGLAWFTEYATIDGDLVKATWCNTCYGTRLRVEMPNGDVVWTSGGKKSLANKGIKKVLCQRPAWFTYKTPYSGMMGAYCGSYELFPSDWNYATGEAADAKPIAIKNA